ncbi:MAG: TolC family protein [bacterium]|nr:TolC family protein [bacterium]MBU1916911.1 TolC family protein [bacterium]
MNKYIFIISLLLILVFNVDISVAKSNTNTNKELTTLIEELLNNNPELKSLVQKINAANDMVSQAAWIDDPRFGFEASNIPRDNASMQRTPMTGMQLYLRQNIPFPTKLGTKKKIARSQKDQMNFAYLEKLNQLVSHFKQIYYEYAYTTNAIAINHKNKRRLDALASILEARYATGTTPQQDVLKTKLESDKIQDTIIQLTKLKEILLARLTTLLARETNTPLKLKGSSTTPQLTQSLTNLQNTATIHRPWLKITDYEIMETRYQHSLAKQELLPNFDFSVGYRIRDAVVGDPVSGEDFLSAGVSINMPFLWTLPKHAKQIAENKHKVLASENKKQAIEQEVIYQVSKAYHDVQMLKSQIHLYQTKLLPESKTTVDASLTSYEASEADYMSLISSQLAKFQHELTLLRHRYDYAIKVAILERAVGKPF